jgi:hypothetical protein
LRYLLVFVPLLAACTASNWNREGATTADLDKDYDDCRMIAKPDPVIAAAFGAFGAIGVLAGTSVTDSKIRSCLRARGWNVPEGSHDAAPAPAPALVKAGETQSPAARRLTELKSLLDQGLITKEEYEHKRQSVLRGL